MNYRLYVLKRLIDKRHAVRRESLEWGGYSFPTMVWEDEIADFVSKKDVDGFSIKGCDHEDLNCPPGECDDLYKEGRDG